MVSFRYCRSHPCPKLWGSGRVAALMMLALAVGGGCAPTVTYQPRHTLVQELGQDAAQRQLRDVLLRATFPKVTVVSFTEDAVIIKSQQSHLGVFYQTVTQQMEDALYFANVERLELYENNYVFIYYGSDRLQMKIRFPTREDAQTFADLVWSLRAALRA